MIGSNEYSSPGINDRDRAEGEGSEEEARQNLGEEIEIKIQNFGDRYEVLDLIDLHIPHLTRSAGSSGT